MQPIKFVRNYFIMDVFQYGGEHHVPKLNFKRARLMESALKDLAEFMSTTVREKERKDKQKLLRNLKVSFCE